MNIDITLDKYFGTKGFSKKHWGGNALIYIKDSDVPPFKSLVFSVVNSLGMLHQVSFGIYFKELTELSYQMSRMINPRLADQKDKRIGTRNINNGTYYSIQKERYQAISFKDDQESTKYEKLFNYYEQIVEPFSEKFQKIEDFEYLYTNAHKLGESDLLNLLYLSKIYFQDRQSKVIALLDTSYQKRLINAKTDRRKSIVIESMAITEKRKKILDALP